MDEFMKMLMKAAEEGKIHIIQMGDEIKCKCTGEAAPKDDFLAEAKKDAEHIATMNKILFDAHIAAGFDEMNAMDLTIAFIESNN